MGEKKAVLEVWSDHGVIEGIGEQGHRVSLERMPFRNEESRWERYRDDRKRQKIGVVERENPQRAAPIETLQVERQRKGPLTDQDRADQIAGEHEEELDADPSELEKAPVCQDHQQDREASDRVQARFVTVGRSLR